VALGSNVVDQWRGAGELQKAIDQQAKAVEGSAKVEAQLDALAKGVQALAAGGNRNVQTIVDVLARNGVKFNAAAN
jgi:hypothetical protein